MEIFLLFMLYSFFGCVAENIYYFMLHRRYVSKRTLIRLPLCPVYGIAGVVLGFVNNSSDGAVMLFCSGFLVVSAVELMFYLVFRHRYGIKWWDYSGMKINLMGGVSLFYSVLWGGANIVFAKFIDPVCKNRIFALPDTFKLLAGAFLAVYFIADIKETAAELERYSRGEKNGVKAIFKYVK